MAVTSWCTPPRPADLPGSGDKLTGLGLYQDSLILLAGFHYVFLLNTKTGRWESYKPPNDKNGNPYQISGLSIAKKKGTLFVFSKSKNNENDIITWVFNNGSLEQVPYKNAAKKSELRTITMDAKGNIYEVSADSIFKWDESGKLLARSALGHTATFVSLQFNSNGTPMRAFPAMSGKAFFSA